MDDSLKGMDDLESQALKRDKMFLVRLIVLLLIGVSFGTWVAVRLTGAGVGKWAADSFGELAPQHQQPSPQHKP